MKFFLWRKLERSAHYNSLGKGNILENSQMNSHQIFQKIRIFFSCEVRFFLLLLLFREKNKNSVHPSVGIFDCFRKCCAEEKIHHRLVYVYQMVFLPKNLPSTKKKHVDLCFQQTKLFILMLLLCFMIYL